MGQGGCQHEFVVGVDQMGQGRCQHESVVGVDQTAFYLEWVLNDNTKQEVELHTAKIDWHLKVGCE